LVIHDDIDLAFERIKIKTKGGDGGHRGVRSVMDAFGGGDFARLRIGVGRGVAVPGGGGSKVVGHVLGRFGAEENRLLEQVLTQARDAVVTILREGVVIGMNRFNGK
jgi:PTH1 family peptidyl-tRNA hydrolase